MGKYSREYKDYYKKIEKDRDKIISWVLMFSWMAFIFYMSHKPGDISTEQSDVIVEFIKTENDYASNLGAARTGGFGSTGN